MGRFQRPSRTNNTSSPIAFRNTDSRPIVSASRLIVGAIDGVAGNDQSNKSQTAKEYQPSCPIRLPPAPRSLPRKRSEAYRYQGAGNADRWDDETE